MKTENYKFNYFSLSPLILLLWGIFSILYIPVIPLASGFGWDGVFYGKVAMNFNNMIGLMDSYHSGRVFPGVLIHYILVLFKLPLTVANALAGYTYFYLFVLVLSGIYWVRITKLLQLNSVNSWIGFISLFVTYPVLNWYLYYPSLTDGTTLFIGILLVYCHLKPNNIVLLLAAIISFFSWPTGIIMCFAIFVYAQKENVFFTAHVNKRNKFIVVLLIISPLLLLVFGSSNLTSITSFFAESHFKGKMFDVIKAANHGIDYSLGRFVNSLFLVAYYIIIYWILLKDFDILKFIRSNFSRDVLFKIFIAALIFAVLVFLKKQLYSPSLPTVTALKGYAIPVIQLSSRFTLQFIICHISYWGPAVILLIIYFQPFVKYLKDSKLDIMLGFLFTIIFSINAESRAITNFYPFIVFVLVQIVDFSKFKNPKLFILVYLFISVAYSKIWLPISLPSTTFPKTLEVGLDKFPLQWYFMNFGLWINYEMYIVHTIVAIIFGSLIYVIIRKSKNNSSDLIEPSK